MLDLFIIRALWVLQIQIYPAFLNKDFLLMILKTSTNISATSISTKFIRCKCPLYPPWLTSARPLTRKNLANSAYVRNRLQIYGYKHFDKISACGKGTYKTLKYMKQSPNLKTVRSVEFDPYLCDQSFLADLVQAIKRFRGIKNLILVVPR